MSGQMEEEELEEASPEIGEVEDIDDKYGLIEKEEEQEEHETSQYNDEEAKKEEPSSPDHVNTSNEGANVIPDQDRFLPICNVARIMRRMIPGNGKMSKDAKESVQEAASEFISFITSEASDKCLAERRKTITSDDLLNAMETLGFDDYIEPLKIFLEKYRCATKANYVKEENRPKFPTMAVLKNPIMKPMHEKEIQQRQMRQGDSSPNITFEEQQQQFTIDESGQIPTTSMNTIQIFVDSSSGQQYVAVPGEDGKTKLIPVEVAQSGTPSQMQRRVGMEGEERRDEDEDEEEVEQEVEETIRKRPSDIGQPPLSQPIPSSSNKRRRSSNNES